jgi:LDH2 family malate/lactate/ureidoglycolate dehydrogenase
LDLRGVDSHGISMIPRYDELRRKGRVRMRRVASKFSTASILRCGAAGFAG